MHLATAICAELPDEARRYAIAHGLESWWFADASTLGMVAGAVVVLPSFVHRHDLNAVAAHVQRALATTPKGAAQVPWFWRELELLGAR